MNEQIHIFDRGLVRRHRERAAAGFSRHRVLFDEIASHLIERIDDVRREFPAVLDLGAHDGGLAQQLALHKNRFVVSADVSTAMLRRGAQPVCVAADEELLPFREGSFDLIVSNLSLHWVNDLPGALAQMRRALKPDGLFLAALIGGQSLRELRSCLMEAELAVHGGVSPRLSPQIDMQSASGLLQRAGFNLPVTDQEFITFTYSDAFALMHDLRGMGEANAQVERSRKGTSRQVFELANNLYQQRYSEEDGRVEATFNVIFMHGWG